MVAACSFGGEETRSGGEDVGVSDMVHGIHVYSVLAEDARLFTRYDLSRAKSRGR